MIHNRLRGEERGVEVLSFFKYTSVHEEEMRWKESVSEGWEAPVLLLKEIQSVWAKENESWQERAANTQTSEVLQPTNIQAILWGAM